MQGLKQKLRLGPVDGRQKMGTDGAVGTTGSTNGSLAEVAGSPTTGKDYPLYPMKPAFGMHPFNQVGVADLDAPGAQMGQIPMQTGDVPGPAGRLESCTFYGGAQRIAMPEAIWVEGRGEGPGKIPNANPEPMQGLEGANGTLLGGRVFHGKNIHSEGCPVHS